MPCVLFFISLVFSALISMPYDVDVFSRRSTKLTSSCSSPAKPSMSSAKRRLLIVLPPMLTVPWWFSKALVTILSRKMLKSVGDSRHPCRTPTVVRNQYSMLLLKITALVALSYRCSMVRTSLEPMLYFLMIAHKAACHTLSKAFLKSMKTWYRLCWCWRCFSQRILRLKICSLVLCPARKLACSSAMISSAWGLCLLSSIFNMTLLGWLMRLIVL